MSFCARRAWLLKEMWRCVSVWNILEHLTKSGTHPQNLDKEGDRAFRRRRRPCSPSNRLQTKICSVCRAPWAPPNHPKFLFSPVYSGRTRVIKSGVWSSTPWWNACARVYPALLSLGSTPFGTILPLFGTLRIGVPRIGSKTPPVGHCSSSWLLWHEVPLRNDQRPRPAQTWSAYVISIRVVQHTAGLGSVITAYHDETWVQVVSLTSISCSSRADPSAPDNADTDNEDSYVYTRRVARVAFQSKHWDWWHWLVACGPHTTQPTMQASPPQGN